MAAKDKRVDAYIEKAQPFAKPILKRLRQLVHKGNPKIEETIKWGMPSFEYKGPLCGMASFKNHAVFGFWKHKLLKDPKGYLEANAAQGGSAMGNLGCIRDVAQLPPDKVIVDFVKQATRLNDENIKLPKRRAGNRKPVKVPSYFMNALKKNRKALENFSAFPPSHKREYVEWITEAKQEETRIKRMKTALEWLEKGKGRNWKYE